MNEMNTSSLLFLVVAASFLSNATTNTAATAFEFRQTILPPRHAERPIDYASELPISHVNTRQNNIFPNHPELGTQRLPPPFWKEPTTYDSYDDKVFYEWHVHVDADLERSVKKKDIENNGRKLESLRQDDSQQQRQQQRQRASLWNRLATLATDYFPKATVASRNPNDNKVHHQQRRRARENVAEYSSPTTSTFNTSDTYEIVNDGNTSEPGDELDLYPYINQTELNITDDDKYPLLDDEFYFVDDETGDNHDNSSPENDNNQGNNKNNTQSSSSSSGSSLPRRFASLRVRAVLTDTLEKETGDAILNETERDLLLHDMVRPAMDAWGNALRVRRVHGNLTLDPRQLEGGGKFCGRGPVTVQVPAHHIAMGIPDTDFVLYLHVARQSSRNVNNNNETLLADDSAANETTQDGTPTLNNDTGTLQFGSGNPRWEFGGKDSNGDDDESLFNTTTAPTASPIDEAYLCSGDYIAASAFCNTDQYDRPIAAILHLCLDDEFFSPKRKGRNTRTIMHELGHSLGFNAISLAHFRRFDGSPRTPRLPSGAVPLQRVQCTGPQLGSRRSDQAEPEQDRLLRLGAPLDNQPVQEPSRDQEANAEPPRVYYDTIPLPSEEILQFRDVRGGVRVAQIVTPSVLQVVRNHFGCQTLAGAELESGEHICLGDHWERRLFKTDLMNPIIDGDATFSSRISTMTLAYFADSGWYQVDLSKASVASNWGRGAGCSFVEEPCIGQDGQVSPGLDSLFCTGHMSAAPMSNSPTLDGCTNDILKKASCLMDQYSEQLPEAYQYFNHTLGSNVGGPDPFVDYCPYFAGFNNGLCTDRANEAFIKVSPLERLGSRNSRCLSGVFYSLRTALCMRIACVVNDKTLRVQVDQTWKTCTHQGQEIKSRLGMKVICPDPIRTCPTFYCPRDCLGSPLVCDYAQGECVCPENNALPFADGTCPTNEDEEDGSASDGSSESPGEGGGPHMWYPFYQPPVTEDNPIIPGDDSPMNDIYFPDERSLIEKTKEEDGHPPFWSWPIVVGSLVVFSVVFWIRRSRRSRERLPVTNLDFPGDNDSPNVTHRPRPSLSSGGNGRRKMMATVAVDLHLQDQLSDVFVQDSNTDAASLTDTEGDHSFATLSASARHNNPPSMREEYLRPTIAIIPPPQPLEIECRSALRRRLRRRFIR